MKIDEGGVTEMINEGEYFKEGGGSKKSKLIDIIRMMVL